MKYRVIKKFKDKYTNEIYKVGAEVDFEDARAQEILNVGKYIEPIEKAVKTAKKPRKKVEK